MWIIFWLDVECDFAFVAYLRDSNQYCHALGHQFPILIPHRKKTHEVNTKTCLVPPASLTVVKKLCIRSLRSSFLHRERNIRWRMVIQFDGFCFTWEGWIPVGVRRGSQPQLCLKQAGGTGTLNDVCVIMDGWTYLMRIINATTLKLWLDVSSNPSRRCSLNN